MSEPRARGLFGRGLEVGYGKTVVLSKADITVTRGITVLLGANGSGKSTLMRALSGAIAPQRGTVSLSGPDVRSSRRELEQCVGVMPQVARPVSWLSVHEYVEYAALLGGVPRSQAKSRAAVALESVGLEPSDQRSTQLSGGMQRRLALAAVLVIEPAVLLLDEPTAGLDPIQRDSIHDLIRSVGETSAVLVSTHLVEDLEELAQGVAVLARGTVAFEGTLPELRALGEGVVGTSSIATALRALHGSEPLARR